MSRQYHPPYRRSQSTPVDRNQPPDLYQQLIESSDLVKELDDIEAISQQISQHAEVLYQTWKNNGMTQGPGKFKLPTTNATPLPTTTSAPTTPTSNGYEGASGGGHSSSPQPYLPNGTSSSNTFPRRGFQLSSPPEQPYRRQNGSTDISGSGRISPDPFSRSGQSYQQSQSMPRTNGTRTKGPVMTSPPSTPTSASPSTLSGLSAPSFITSKSATLPSRTSTNGDNFDKNPDVAKSLDLLAAPEVNGSLKELVNSFVSTDRAKQAARQTIANTINNMTKRNGGLRSGSPSSSSSPFSSRAVSPLRSPMLAAGVTPNGNGSSSLASLTSLGGLSPTSSTIGPLSPTGSTTSSSNASSVITDSSRMRTQSPTRSMSEVSTTRLLRPQSPPTLPMLNQALVHQKMTPMFMSNGETAKPWQSPSRDPIPIPVQHVGNNSSEGLRSPVVLNTLRQPSLTRDQVDRSSPGEKKFSLEPVNSVRPMQEIELGKAALPMANLHLAHVDQMKKRVEEAKQRLNMMHERALFGSPAPFHRSDEFLDGPSGNGLDDPSGHSSFLFDQFRRRVAAKNKQAALPHPELTPQQKQHIYERSSSTPSGTSLISPQQPLRRILSGGSVAERVMIFERCPTAFNPQDPAKDGRIGTGGFPPGSLSLLADKKRDPAQPQTSTPWKSHAIDAEVRNDNFKLIKFAIIIKI